MLPRLTPTKISHVPMVQGTKRMIELSTESQNYTWKSSPPQIPHESLVECICFGYEVLKKVTLCILPLDASHSSPFASFRLSTQYKGTRSLILSVPVSIIYHAPVKLPSSTLPLLSSPPILLNILLSELRWRSSRRHTWLDRPSTASGNEAQGTVCLCLK